MKVIQWIADVVAFAIYTALLGFGIWMLTYGFSIHSIEIEGFGLFVICISMLGLALDWNDKTKRFINGKNEKTNKGDYIC